MDVAKNGSCQFNDRFFKQLKTFARYQTNKQHSRTRTESLV